MVNINTYVAFSRLMELRSFSAVAKEMALSQSTVSKHISALERDLGHQLFVRTTRTLIPTVEASDLAEVVHELIEAHTAIRDFALHSDPAPKGLLRIAAPVSFGQAYLSNRVIDFIARQPKIDVDLRLCDDPVSLLPESADLAIFSGEPRLLSMRVRSLTTFERVVICSKKYAARNGVPAEPIDLEDHDIVLAKCFSGERFDFESESGRQSVSLRARLSTNNEMLAYELARAGHGITIVPSWIADSDPRFKNMKLLLGNYYLPEIPISIGFPQTKFVSHRLRTFINFLVADTEQ